MRIVLDTNAQFIVSEDKHFKELAEIPFPRVGLSGIEDFLTTVKNFH